MYRPPPAPTVAFFDELSDMISEVLLLSGNLIIVGDLNCPGRSSITVDDRLTAVLADYDMVQRVRTATHIASSSTGVDNILDVVIHHRYPSPV